MALEHKVVFESVISEEFLKLYGQDSNFAFLNDIKGLLDDELSEVIKLKESKASIVYPFKMDSKGEHTSGRPSAIHVKVTFYDFSKRVKTLFLASRAKKSWQAAAILKRAGLHTPWAIAYKEAIKGFWVIYDYYVTEYFPDCKNVKEFIFQCKTDHIHVDPLLKALAHEIAKMHNSRITHGDLKSGNILIEQSGQDFRFFITDLDRVKKRFAMTAISATKDFGTLYSSLSDLLTTKELSILLKYYLMDIKITTLNKKRFTKNVVKICKKRSRHKS